MGSAKYTRYGLISQIWLDRGSRYRKLMVVGQPERKGDAMAMVLPSTRAPLSKWRAFLAFGALLGLTGVWGGFLMFFFHFSPDPAAALSSLSGLAVLGLTGWCLRRRKTKHDGPAR